MKVLIGFLLGAAVTFVSLDQFLSTSPPDGVDLYARITGTNIVKPRGMRNYTFSPNGILESSGHPDEKYDHNAVNIHRSTLLLTLKPDSVKHICFFTEHPLVAGSYGTLRLSIYLKPEMQSRYLTMLRENAGQFLIMTYGGQKIAGLTPSYNFETSLEFLLDPSKPFPENTSEFSEISLRSWNENVGDLVSFAKYLSPRTAPSACPGGADLNEIPWWWYAIERYWSEKAYAREKRVEEIVDRFMEASKPQPETN